MAGLGLEGSQMHRWSDREGMNGVIPGIESGLVMIPVVILHVQST
jgi:hypothetical protein